MVLEGRKKNKFFKFNFMIYYLRYDILNLQGSADDLEHQLHYVQVGTWSTGKLTLNASAIRLFSDQRPLDQINIRRFCSEACQSGHVKVIIHHLFIY
jgi:hypothetical protein